MFIIVNMRRYRFFIVVVVTFLIVTWMLMFPQHLLRFFYPLNYESIVFEYAEHYQIDPYLVMAVIKVESSFRPDVESHKGAKGLMQLMDTTAQWGADQIGLEGFDIEQVYDPDTNVRIGCWYLNNLMKEFNRDIHLVLAAYNGGSGNVRKWLNDKTLSRSGKSLDRIPFRETEQYVEKVMRSYSAYKKIYDASE